jgi:uncharacterized membrane protein
MREREQDGRQDIDAQVVRKAMVCSMVLLVVLTVGGYLLQGWIVARSLLIGGLLLNGSFWLMQKDVRRLLRRVSEIGDDAGIRIEQIRFRLRSLARLVVVGLVIFALASRMPINAIGFIAGAATVMVSAVIIGLGAGRRWPSDNV